MDRGADDSVWGGKPGAAAKARLGMEKHYGASYGMKVYAAKTHERRESQAGIQGALRIVRSNAK